MKLTVESRIWKDSGLIGRKLCTLEKEYHVTISKVSRGNEAACYGSLEILEGDYLTYVGTGKNCAKFLVATGSSRSKWYKNHPGVV